MAATAISSCAVDKKSTLFYVGKGDFVHTLTASQEKEREEDEGRETYDDKILKVGGTEIKSLTKEMAAISFLQDGKTAYSSRLYYSDKDGVLQGLNKEGADPWDASDIGTLKCKVVKDSSLTAVWSPDVQSVKVYYYKDGEKPRPWVAWWATDKRRWKTEST